MGKVAGGGSWWGVIAALVVSAAVGALVALPALRLRGLYLALATLAFAEAMSVAFFGNNSYIPEGQSLAVKTLDIPGLGTPTPSEELIVITVAFLLCAALVLGIRRNVFGRRLVAMSDSPTALATLGLVVGQDQSDCLLTVLGHGRVRRGLLRPAPSRTER